MISESNGGQKCSIIAGVETYSKLLSSQSLNYLVLFWSQARYEIYDSRIRYINIVYIHIYI